MVARIWSSLVINLLDKVIAHGDWIADKMKLKWKEKKIESIWRICTRFLNVDCFLDDTYIYTDQNIG